MAGLFDRLYPTDGTVGIGGHSLSAVICLYEEGWVSAAEAKTYLNNLLDTPLGVDASTDLTNIAATISGPAADRLRRVAMIEAAGQAVEDGQINEAKWRTILGIPTP